MVRARGRRAHGPGHQSAHHRKAVLRVRKTGGAVPRLLRVHIQKLRAFLAKMNRLTVGGAVGFHPFIIGDRHRDRSLRLADTAVQLELNIKKASKNQCFLLLPAGEIQHFHRLIIIRIIIVSARQDLLHRQHNTLRKTGIRAIGNADHIISTGIGKLR